MSRCHTDSLFNVVKSFPYHLSVKELQLADVVKNFQEDRELSRTWRVRDCEIAFELRHNLSVEEYKNSERTGEWFFRLVDDFKKEVASLRWEKLENAFYTVFFRDYRLYLGSPIWLKGKHLGIWARFQKLFRQEEGMTVRDFKIQCYKKRYPSIVTLQDIFDRLSIVLSTIQGKTRRVQQAELDHYNLAKNFSFRDSEGRSLVKHTFRQEFYNHTGRHIGSYYTVPRKVEEVVEHKQKEDVEHKQKEDVREKLRRSEELRREKERLERKEKEVLVLKNNLDKEMVSRMRGRLRIAGVKLSAIASSFINDYRLEKDLSDMVEYLEDVFMQHTGMTTTVYSEKHRLTFPKQPKF